jgi:hypothetical protein
VTIPKESLEDAASVDAEAVRAAAANAAGPATSIAADEARKSRRFRFRISDMHYSADLPTSVDRIQNE